MNNKYNTDRFLSAQEVHYSIALEEIKSGRKRSHWMWFIFPQIKGLGSSPTSVFYSIENLEEARAYLAHPVTGNRLKEISSELLKLNTSDAHSIFGSPDDLKLKSSMTLFAELQSSGVFQEVLNKFFKGDKDLITLELLRNPH